MKQSNIDVSRQGAMVVSLQGLQTETTMERLGGLLVVRKLQSEEALWIAPCNSIHTFGMKYSLDLIYVDKNNSICGLSEHVKPWRVSGCFYAKATVELLAGSINHYDIRLGDSCTWQK